MAKILDLKKGRWWREIVVVFVSIIVTSAGIKASDRWSDEAASDGLGPCPPEMAFVTAPGGGFCIDRYEASAGPDCPVPDPSSLNDSRLNVEDQGCLTAVGAGTRPWRYLSQNQAALACAKAGKRLPTNQEWQAAALGTPDPDIGWGSADCQVAKNWPEQPGLCGAGTNCRSAAGVYDLVGNVWEWTGETVTDGTLDTRVLPGEGYVGGLASDGLPSLTGEAPDPQYRSDYHWLKPTDVRAVARGGYWDSREKGGAYSSYAVLDPSTAGPGIGFRCVY